ncbi:long-chain-acyl-CoA synthetase [Seongchinamella sediminis]|uniref:Long-chain-acyl-CoA synthetase n=1 Tax=Seongchinamella sediminis TaxID=2283635 RepID=A0A3L7DYH8_9GAMM|nr:long-chain-acyl-CoA synthetase [Seongchinamella sediminis]RLQ22657.1 long-chain-acyl-CoA synthetase [Seongchinamella sediminis]
MTIKDITSTLSQVPTLLSLARYLKPKPPGTRDCFAARVESLAQRHGDSSALVCEGQELTWRQLNGLANRYARALKGIGMKRGECCALFMENRVDFLACLIALNKLGVIAALINTNLQGKALSHCLEITDARWCLFGEERLAAIDEVRQGTGAAAINTWIFAADSARESCPNWATDLAEESEYEPPTNPPETAEGTIADKALYIFTSGTTGLPKAAVMSNRRFILTSTLASHAGLQCDINDRIYLCLPLYHGTALFLGAGAAFNTGASIFLRRKFSATQFLPEVREYGTTCFMYIGEICRYLMSTPQAPDDYQNPLTKVMGNGLRPDIWMEFKERFGISRVAEFYGSSEGNMGFVNLLNKDCTVGTGSLPHTLVKYDVEADEVILDDKGFCIKAEPGEPGLLLGKISKVAEFEGYTSAEATEKKIMRDVYESGDAWFNTGDLLKTVDVGFALGLPHYQFVDRVGDTFRWMSENVSTNEVGEVINTHPQIKFCNVYGVELPNTNGRAGMAAILLEDGEEKLDLDSFSAQVREQLPTYARPLFLRLLPEMDTTGTFKMLKGELREQRYDPDQVSDPLYVMKPGSDRYEPLTRDFASLVLAGKAGY